MCHVALSPVWQHVTEFVELLMTFPAQEDHKLQRQFKTTPFGRHIYIFTLFHHFVAAMSTDMITTGRENN